jgi:prepilin-type processing-associated H-X9-DG protein
MPNYIIKRYVNDLRQPPTLGPYEKDVAIQALASIKMQYDQKGADILQAQADSFVATLNGKHQRFVIEQAIEDFKPTPVDPKTAKLLVRDRYQIVRYDDGVKKHASPFRTRRVIDKYLSDIRLAVLRAQSKLVKRRIGVRVYSRMYDTVIDTEFTVNYEEGRNFTIMFADGHVVKFQIQHCAM